MNNYAAGSSYTREDDCFETHPINQISPPHDEIIRVYRDIELRDRIIALLNTHDLIFPKE